MLFLVGIFLLFAVVGVLQAPLTPPDERSRDSEF